MSELDKIKSTITMSLGTKNKLRELKGSDSYETYINYLLTLRNKMAHNTNNSIEFQKLSRKKAIYSFESFKIIFAYNQYNNSENFNFDIALEKVRKNGKIITFKEFINNLKELMPNKSLIDIEYRIYFQLLEIAINKEINSMFKHKGRFEDYYSWNQEFKKLGLSKIAFEDDIMEKLREYEQGLRLFNNGHN